MDSHPNLQPCILKIGHAERVVDQRQCIPKLNPRSLTSTAQQEGYCQPNYYQNPKDADPTITFNTDKSEQSRRSLVPAPSKLHQASNVSKSFDLSAKHNNNFKSANNISLNYAEAQSPINEAKWKFLGDETQIEGKVDASVDKR